MLQPEIAARLRERKLGNLRATDPDLVAAGNIGCITQLAGGGVPVVHTIELLDWMAGGPIPSAVQRKGRLMPARSILLAAPAVRRVCRLLRAERRRRPGGQRAGARRDRQAARRAEVRAERGDRRSAGTSDQAALAEFGHARGDAADEPRPARDEGRCQPGRDRGFFRRDHARSQPGGGIPSARHRPLRRRRCTGRDRRHPGDAAARAAQLRRLRDACRDRRIAQGLEGRLRRPGRRCWRSIPRPPTARSA